MLLVLLRLLQGFGAGAELSGALTVVAEFAPPHQRGRLMSFVLAAPPAGGLLATVAFLAVSSLPTPDLLGWAWRIPFLLSAVLFFVALFIRKRMSETPEFLAVVERQEEQRRVAVPAGELLRTSWRRVLVAFFSITGHNANYYTLAAFALSFLTKTGGMPRSQALLAVSLGSLLAVLTTPIGGILCDRFGAAKVMLAGMLGGILYAYPLFMAMASGNLGAVMAVFVVGYGLILVATSAPQGAVYAGLLPPQYRFSGMAMSRELNGALVAGTAPLIVSWLVTVDGGGITLAAGYLILMFAISAVALLFALRIPEEA